jgi:outer membrane protein OmpA-like peptidoglycan-associated protein
MHDKESAPPMLRSIRFTKEEPKIDAAIENFMSVLLAEGLTAPDSSGQDPATFEGPSEHAGNENAPQRLKHTRAHEAQFKLQTAQVLARTLWRQFVSTPAITYFGANTPSRR